MRLSQPRHLEPDGGMRRVQELEIQGIAYDNVIHIVVLELGSQIDVNLNPILRVLFFNGMQERVEPFGAPKVADDPGEVDFGEASGLRVVEVVHPVPNRLEDSANPV